MVRPEAFGFNAETASTNRFQATPEAVTANAATSFAVDAAARARAEFDGTVSVLRGEGLQVCVAADSPEPPKPDAVFPNNWVSFHEDGTVVLYPMRDPSRRRERNEALIDSVKRELGFVERRRYDLTGEERRGRFLEGTGSLVLDRARRLAYACRSPRTDEGLAREWAREMGYEPVVFDAASPDCTPVYHTNVLLWIGERICGCGLEWVDDAQRGMLESTLREAGRDLLRLDGAALRGYAGNMLELGSGPDASLLAASRTAWNSLSGAQRDQLEQAACRVVLADIPTIETLGGGSLRCMLAEVPPCPGPPC